MSQPTKTDRLFKAIADPTRRRIFHVLVVASASMSITQLANDFEISRQGVTKHLKTLENAGLVSLRTDGRERFCIPNVAPLKEIQDWLKFYERFWDDSFDRLGNYLGGNA